MNLIEGSAQCGHDRWRSTCAIETIGRMRVFWSLGHWKHVSGTAEMALHCAVVLALFFWFVCVLGVCVGLPVHVRAPVLLRFIGHA